MKNEKKIVRIPLSKVFSAKLMQRICFSPPNFVVRQGTVQMRSKLRKSFNKK